MIIITDSETGEALNCPFCGSRNISMDEDIKSCNECESVFFAFSYICKYFFKDEK